MGKIFFFSADKAGGIKDKKAFKEVLAFLFEKENVGLKRLNYIFCSDEYLVKINQQYLNHNTLTDVITFPFSEKDEPVSAEIYISVERIKENAKTYRIQYQNELLRVMIHGALHLCGYEDKKQSLQLRMREKEDYYLNQFKVSREANT
jgi:probable rRNA maturation factor